MKIGRWFFLIFLLIPLSSGCHPASPSPSVQKVVAVENFLADIAQNVAGDRWTISSLIPYGIEPHEYEPAPQDLVAVAESAMLLVNGGGLEGWLEDALRNVGGTRILITASAGLQSRPAAKDPSKTDSSGTVADPHYWLNPILVKTYVSNILDGFIQLDPSGAELYRRNAETYISSLKELDAWIQSRVASIPAEERILITNHESLGYFADHYGFEILGSIFPGVSPEAQPSAAQISDLILKMRASHAKAIFLDVGTNTQLADQIAQETGCRVVTDLYTHSLTPAGGVAPTYLDMMRYDVNIMVEALL